MHKASAFMIGVASVFLTLATLAQLMRDDASHVIVFRAVGFVLTKPPRPPHETAGKLAQDSAPTELRP